MRARINFRQATVDDAEVIGQLVCELTREITQATGADLLDDRVETINTCMNLMGTGQYAGLLAEVDNQVVGVVTFTETYALYAGGKIGLIQEFYVCPDYRSCNLGSLLLAEIKKWGISQNWKCVELCTPPLPAFERTLAFYQKNGLIPVGGRKMREMLT